jgi:hypothetical protein
MDILNCIYAARVHNMSINYCYYSIKWSLLYFVRMSNCFRRPYTRILWNDLDNICFELHRFIKIKFIKTIKLLVTKRKLPNKSYYDILNRYRYIILNTYYNIYVILYIIRLHGWSSFYYNIMNTCYYLWSCICLWWPLGINYYSVKFFL